MRDLGPSIPHLLARAPSQTLQFVAVHPLKPPSVAANSLKHLISSSTPTRTPHFLIVHLPEPSFPHAVFILTLGFRHLGHQLPIALCPRAACGPTCRSRFCGAHLRGAVLAREVVQLRTSPRSCMKACGHLAHPRRSTDSSRAGTLFSSGGRGAYQQDFHLGWEDPAFLARHYNR
jgi:hypothetical protein